MSEGHTERLEAALDGKYLIERKLGEGGMATVYLAQDVKHKRKVALKILKPELAAVIGAERFLTEITTTAGLQHPHILALHDSGEASGYLYYVMPYIEGETLRDKLDREKQLGVEESVRIARDVADALDYAHRQGVIHRDIKPGNILLHDGRPVVADFGIALAVSAAGGGRMTETGLSLGTPHYMSPEQASADRDLSARSDVYSLGCVLYEMIGGQPPHTGPSAQSILVHILTKEATPLTELRHTVPPHVAATVSKSIEKLPADRFESAKDFMEALGDVGFAYEARKHIGSDAASIDQSASEGSHAGPWNRLSVALAGMSFALTVVLGLSLFRPQVPSPLARFFLQTPEGAVIGGICCGPTLALSPDGEWLALTAVGGGPIYRRRLGQLTPEPIAGTEGGRMPFFSPDSRWLGFYQDGYLRRVPMSGGPPQAIAEIPEPNNPSWGDNDVIIFTDRITGSLSSVPAAGGVPNLIGDASDGILYSQAWTLPGSEAALVVLRAPSAENMRTAVFDLETGAIDTLGFGTTVRYAADHIVFTGSDGTLLAQPFDAGTRRTTGQSVAILDGVALSGPGSGEFAVSADGGLVYIAGSSGGALQALVVDGANGRVPIELPEEGDLEYPAFSPVDGRRIALVFVDVGDNPDLWIWDRDQESLTIFTVEGSSNFIPVWTPDGSRIAFSSTRDSEPPQIYWRAADGSGVAERLIETDFLTVPQSWSPDGQTLALHGRPNGHADIGLVTLGDPEVRWVVATEFEELQPQISPDGFWLAYTSDRSGQQEVYVEAMSGEGGRTTVSTDGGHSPRWAPNDDVLYYAASPASAISGTIIAATFAAESGFRVVSREERFGVQDLNSNAGVNYDVSPDGEEFVHVSIGGTGGRQLVWILNWPHIVEELTSTP